MHAQQLGSKLEGIGISLPAFQEGFFRISDHLESLSIPSDLNTNSSLFFLFFLSFLSFLGLMPYFPGHHIYFFTKGNQGTYRLRRVKKPMRHGICPGLKASDRNRLPAPYWVLLYVGVALLVARTLSTPLDVL